MAGKFGSFQHLAWRIKNGGIAVTSSRRGGKAIELMHDRHLKWIVAEVHALPFNRCRLVIPGTTLKSKAVSTQFMWAFLCTIPFEFSSVEEARLWIINRADMKK